MTDVDRLGFLDRMIGRTADAIGRVADERHMCERCEDGTAAYEHIDAMAGRMREAHDLLTTLMSLSELHASTTCRAPVAGRAPGIVAALQSRVHLATAQLGGSPVVDWRAAAEIRAMAKRVRVAFDEG